jgi:hypothetical protein
MDERLDAEAFPLVGAAWIALLACCVVLWWEVLCLLF